MYSKIRFLENRTGSNDRNNRGITTRHMGHPFTRGKAIDLTKMGSKLTKKIITSWESQEINNPLHQTR